MKLLISLLLLLSFIGCSVDGTSGGSNAPANPSNPTNTTDPANPTDTTNPTDINTTDTTNPTDTNTTDTTNPIDSNDPSGCKAEGTCIFDSIGSIYDESACDANFYKVASDASYNGQNSGENGSDFLVIENQGLNIKSDYLEGDSTKSDKTWVTVFYKGFPSKNDLDNQGFTSYQVQDVFTLTYDNAWTDASIANIDNKVYVQSLKTEQQSCYRVVLNSLSNNEAEMQKVYR